MNLLKPVCVFLCLVFATAAFAQGGASGSSDVTTAKEQKSIERKANRKLSLDVRRALAKSNGVEVSGITVLARSGDVTLTGSVPEAPQIDKASEVAKGVPGVTTVINKLTIGSPYGQ
ncbi:BON domain-containing protein [Paraburkholderia sediminicola]|uniref:BON domain-containing protein n=1 Tax=Paraburkholderia sediminicola TaxID=458836 RepID=UPI0038BABCCD